MRYKRGSKRQQVRWLRIARDNCMNQLIEARARYLRPILIVNPKEEL
jgi:hypothetical protein